MSLDQLQYFTKDIATSLCESFHSYLAFWAPKGIYFSSSYACRVAMAQLCWNDNKEFIKKELERKKEAEKGKRSRGRNRSMWTHPKNYDWIERIFKNIQKL